MQREGVGREGVELGTGALRAAIVAWPAFVTAGVIEAFVFAFVDPTSLHTLDGGALQLSATAVYSLAFLVFWALVGAACLVALRLASSAGAINAAPGQSRSADDAG